MKISKITTVLVCAFALCCLAALPSLAAEKKPESVFSVKDGEWVLKSGGETAGTNGASTEQGMYWYAVDPEHDEAAKGLQQGILLYNAATEKYSFLPTTEEQTRVEGISFSPDAGRMVLSCNLNRFASGFFVYTLPALTLEKSFWGRGDVWFVDNVRFAFTLVDQKVERPEQAGMWASSAAVYDPSHDAGYVVVKGATKTESVEVMGVEGNEIAITVTTVKAEKDWEDVEKQQYTESKVEVPAAG